MQLSSCSLLRAPVFPEKQCLPFAPLLVPCGLFFFRSMAHVVLFSALIRHALTPVSTCKFMMHCPPEPSASTPPPPPRPPLLHLLHSRSLWNPALPPPSTTPHLKRDTPAAMRPRPPQGFIRPLQCLTLCGSIWALLIELLVELEQASDGRFKVRLTPLEGSSVQRVMGKMQLSPYHLP